MATENIRLRSSGSTDRIDVRRRWPQLTALVLVVVAGAWALTYATTSISGTRVGNPVAPARTHTLSWGGLSVDHFWVPVFYGITAAVMLLMIWNFIRH